MFRFRRRFLTVLPVTALAAWWSCAPALQSLEVPAHINVNALRDSILAIAPPDSTFSVFDGDEQYVADPWLGPNTYGIILPHSQAHGTALHHKKFLARIWVDRNYRGLKANTWTYWVVVDTSAAGSGQFASMWVAPHQTAKLRSLTLSARPHSHPHSRGQWQNQSKAVAWATCTTYECCCEGSECNEPQAFGKL